jgi:tetratricopeptide (TPR) repeat protein
VKEKMKRFYKEVLFFVFALVAFGYLNEYMLLKDNEIKLNEYIGVEGKTAATTNLKLFGLKKAGRSMLWIKQILDVGGHRKDTEQQKLNSEMMSYLDPYFKVNYYYSSLLLALIRTNNRHDYGMEILYRGMRYFPDDKMMPLYMGGIAADKANNIDESLIYFEKIVETLKDERLLHTIAYIYDEKYEEADNLDKKEEYMKKSLHYYEQLLDAKTTEYKERAEKKIKEYYKNTID